MEKDAIQILIALDREIKKSNNPRRCILKEDIDKAFKEIKAQTAHEGYEKRKDFEDALPELIKAGKVLEVQDMGTLIGYCLPWHDKQRARKLREAAQAPGYRKLGESNPK